MKISSKKKISKRTWLVIITALLILAIAGTAYAWYKHTHPGVGSSSINSAPPTKEQTAAGDQAKKATVDKPTPSTNGTNSTPSQSTSGKSAVDTTITAAAQSDSIVQVRALVSTVETNGTCTLTLSKVSDTTTAVTKTSGIEALANSTTCQGFNVSTSELSPGDWHIDLKYESDRSTGEATGMVTVR